MTKNKNLAAVLRNCADMSTPCGNCPYKETDGICIKMLLNDAAGAIEAPNRLVDLNTERCEGLRKQLREAQEQYEKHLNELEQQLPKRGEWIIVRESRESVDIPGEIHPAAFKWFKCICSTCRNEYVFPRIPQYCPDCGSMNTAKMEEEWRCRNERCSADGDAERGLPYV